MKYNITIDNFDGPLDLLLHLTKTANIDICDISILEVTKQYLDYINAMKEMNLNIASEYLAMAAELIEMKSRVLLPRGIEEESEDEENPKDNLIRRLLEYKKYKEITVAFRELELERKQYYSKEPSDLREYKEEKNYNNDGDIDDLVNAFMKFLKKKELDKPLNTKVTLKEYSVSVRCEEIKNLIKKRKKIMFEDLFEIYNKDYIIVTFLSILDLAKKQELSITQENNFQKIFLIGKECE